MSGWQPARLSLVMITLLAAARCTTPASWQNEGSAGAACFPDGTCDRGLRCVEGRCQLPVISTSDARVVNDQATDDQALQRDLPTCSGSRPPLPVLKPLPETTSQASYPVIGHAPEAVQVLISGGAAPRNAPTQEGYFCADVPLKANTLNELELIAVDEAGCVSDPVSAAIRQQAISRTNQLLGKAVWSSDQPKAGALSQLTDGMTNAVVKFWFYDLTPACDESIALAFDLKQPAVLDQVIVRYPDIADFKHFLTCWALLASDEINPPPPQRASPSWRLLAESKEETGGPLTIPLAGGGTVRQLALLMYQDGSAGMWESFDLTEVEAWGAQELEAPLSCP